MSQLARFHLINFRAAVRAFSLACPADYCFIVTQYIAYIVILGEET